LRRNKWPHFAQTTAFSAPGRVTTMFVPLRLIFTVVDA